MSRFVDIPCMRCGGAASRVVWTGERYFGPRGGCDCRCLQCGWMWLSHPAMFFIGTTFVFDNSYPRAAASAHDEGKTMRDIDVAEMAERAAEEIDNLRGEIARLRPKAEAYDLMTTIFGMMPRARQGYEPDMAHRLRDQARQVREAIKASKPGAASEAPPEESAVKGTGES